MTRRGFTLVELLVVLAIIAVLLTIATPRYIQHVERARETALRSSLRVMRDAIDKFVGDQGRYPASLEDLVARSYLKSVPIDPITEKTDTWIPVTPAESLAAAAAAGLARGAPNGSSAGASANGAKESSTGENSLDTGMADIHSGAEGNGLDGTPYKEW